MSRPREDHGSAVPRPSESCLREGNGPWLANALIQLRPDRGHAWIRACLTTGYAFNGGGNSRLVPDQTSNAYTRRDGEDKLLV